jgi:hypothetical protein
VPISPRDHDDATSLMHLQDRFRVMGYRKIHENSDLCTFVLR